MRKESSRAPTGTQMLKSPENTNRALFANVSYQRSINIRIKNIKLGVTTRLWGKKNKPSKKRMKSFINDIRRAILAASFSIRLKESMNLT